MTRICQTSLNIFQLKRIQVIPNGCERLSEFLLSQGYNRGTSDRTLFIKKKREDIILV